MILNQVQKNSIITNEKGILSKKGRGFHFPSTFARENLPHLLWSDEYICDQTYKVDRKLLSCYVLMNVVAGKMTVRIREKTYTASDGDFLFMDLRHPHYYKAETAVQVQQYMIDGKPLNAYHRLLTEKHGPVFRKDSRIAFQLSSLNKETLKPFPNDHVISMLIIGLLTSVSVSSEPNLVDPVQQARYYITDHYRDDISLDDIAAAVSLSKFYFTRIFEKETGSTPWEFLIETRVRNSMQLLTHSNMSIEQVAISCGFSDATHFIRTFKKFTGFTPGVFRQHFNGVTIGFEFAMQSE